MEPHDDSKVFAGNHVSADVPDWYSQRQQPMSSRGTLYWWDVPQRSYIYDVSGWVA